jgi:predicted phosphodiesterase
VICGHIHKAEMRSIDGITYINDGDWVESCTAAIEHADGSFEIIDWGRLRGWSMLARRQTAAPVAEPALAA